MKSEKFLKMLGGIDSKLVENVRNDIDIWRESNEGVSFTPAPRKSHWKAVTASVVGSATVLCGAFALKSNFGRPGTQFSPAANGIAAAESLTESKVTSRSEQAAPQKLTELPKIKAAVMNWDPDTVYEVLGNGDPYLAVSKIEDKFYPGAKRTGWTYDLHGKELLFLSSGYETINYFDQGDVNHYMFLSSDRLYYSDPHIKHVDALDSFTKEEAVQRVREAAKKLGITNLGEPTVFAMTAEDANAYYDYLDGIHALSEPHDESKGDCEFTRWTKDDEAYFIKFPLVYEGIKLEDSSVVQKPSIWGYFDNGCYVMAAVTKERITEFEAWGITSPDYTVMDSVKINFSKEDILNKFAADVPEYITMFANKVEIVDCELTYAPVEKLDNYEVVYAPVWKVSCAKYHDMESADGTTSEDVDREVVLYSAETGEIVETHGHSEPSPQEEDFPPQDEDYQKK